VNTGPKLRGEIVANERPLSGLVTLGVLVSELTANVTMLLPMVVACFAAMLVPTLFRNVPILDSLRERLLAGSERTGPAAPSSPEKGR